MSMDGQDAKRRRNITENFNRLSMAHKRYRQTGRRQTTDGRTTTYSERSRSLKSTSDIGKRTAVILKFYFKFLFWPNFRHRRVILHWLTKF